MREHRDRMKRMTAVPAIKRWMQLGQGAEKLELPEEAEAPLRRILLRAAQGENARAEVEGVLRLMVALETRLASPTAASRLRSWLRDTPELHDLIRTLGFSGAKGLDFTRDFLRREGRSIDLAAPRYDSVTPAGAVPLRQLIETRPRRLSR